ncbi:DUF2971 domain-containing protein [Enterobacter ludwigii]|uniref:DUF2971 domain-containing protein n=1 Tax=Enterobacter ludwigii TaxID=299767 RepID=UPI003C2AE928
MGLFHYTDLHGLKGIVSQSELWATNIFFLNDKEESHHGCRCFKNTVSQLGSDVIPENRKRTLLKSISDYEQSRMKGNFSPERHVYSISFSKKKNKDKLSQWRGYGNKQGVCIEFDQDKLTDFLNQTEMNCLADEVIYTTEKDTVAMSKKLKDFFIAQELNLLESNDHYTIMALSYHYLSQMIPFFKNDAFSEEDEFRYVFTPRHVLPKVEFRVNDNGLIPYIVLGGKDGAKLPILSVVIGPVKDYEFVREGVRMLLDANGYEHVEITPSVVPYRV